MSLAWNAGSSYARFVVCAVVSFALTPVVLESVGRDDFALWALSFSMLGFLGLLDFGLTTTVIKYVGESCSTGKLERRNSILSVIFLVYLALAAVGALAIGGLSLVFNDFFQIPAAQQEKATTLLWILGLRAVVLNLPLGLFRAILFGSKRIGLVNVVQACGMVAYGVAAAVGLSNGMGLVGLAWVNLGAMLVENVAYLILCFRHVPDLRFTLAGGDRATFIQVALFGGSQLIVNVSALVLLRADPLLIKMFLPLSAVAVYAIALKIAESVHLLTKQFINAMAPYIAALAANGERRAIRNLFLQGSKWALAPAVLLATSLSALSDELLEAWVGPDFVAAAPILVVLLIAVTFGVMEMMASAVLTMTGRHQQTARAGVVASFVNVLVSLLLVGSLGLIGVAFGTLIATIVTNFALVLRPVCREYNIRFRSYVADVLLPVLWPAALALVATELLALLYKPTGLLEIVEVATPGALLYVGSFFALGLSRHERDEVVSRLRLAVVKRLCLGEET
ncbi:MAG: hypothetical protein E2P02_03070 [Acidobacteria bacterium]|nr:MAG: hypothetical protein E2P02_03070 [Acidobacteriota bacterium]